MAIKIETPDAHTIMKLLNDNVEHLKIIDSRPSYRLPAEYNSHVASILAYETDIADAVDHCIEVLDSTDAGNTYRSKGLGSMYLLHISGVKDGVSRVRIKIAEDRDHIKTNNQVMKGDKI